MVQKKDEAAEGIQRKKNAIVERAKGRAQELQKQLEYDVANRVKLIYTEMDKQTEKIAMLDQLTSRLKTLLSRSVSSDFDCAMSEANRCTGDKAESIDAAEYFPSSFASILEPDFGLELIERRAKVPDGGRNAGLQPGQATDRDPQDAQDPLVRYKDTFSTCDNRTISRGFPAVGESKPEPSDSAAFSSGMGNFQGDDAVGRPTKESEELPKMPPGHRRELSAIKEFSYPQPNTRATRKKNRSTKVSSAPRSETSLKVPATRRGVANSERLCRDSGSGNEIALKGPYEDRGLFRLDSGQLPVFIVLDPMCARKFYYAATVPPQTSAQELFERLMQTVSYLTASVNVAECGDTAVDKIQSDLCGRRRERGGDAEGLGTCQGGRLRRGGGMQRGLSNVGIDRGRRGRRSVSEDESASQEPYLNSPVFYSATAMCILLVSPGYSGRRSEENRN